MNARSLFLLLLLSPLPAAAEEMSLRIADVRIGPTGGAGEAEFVYTLVNTSAKTITSWYFSCLDPSYGERSGLGSTGYDGYMTEDLDLGSAETSLILPGQTILHTVRRGPRLGPLKVPYTPQDCAPHLAIFADATFEGDPGSADSQFQSRAGNAVDAYRARLFLQNELDQGVAISEAVDRLIAANLPGSFQENVIQGKSRNSEIISFEANRGQTDYDSIGAALVLEQLDRHYRLAVKHVPPHWQRKIAAQIAFDLRQDSP